jgi:hypothetical protein
MSTRKDMKYLKRHEAIKRVKEKMNREVHKALEEEYKKGFMNEKFSKIMELKLKWELGEISKDRFMKFTKNHVMDCWAFKFMNKKKDLSAIKIQKLWRKYKEKKYIINNIMYESESDNEQDWKSYENDILEQTIYIWNNSCQI